MRRALAREQVECDLQPWDVDVGFVLGEGWRWRRQSVGVVRPWQRCVVTYVFGRDWDVDACRAMFEVRVCRLGRVGRSGECVG